jgi:hypothetical protein
MGGGVVCISARCYDNSHIIRLTLGTHGVDCTHDHRNRHPPALSPLRVRLASSCARSSPPLPQLWQEVLGRPQDHCGASAWLSGPHGGTPVTHAEPEAPITHNLHNTEKATACGCSHSDAHDADGCTATWTQYEGTIHAYAARCGCLRHHTQSVHERLVTITMTRSVSA